MLYNARPNTNISVTLPNNDPIRLTSSRIKPLSHELLAKAKAATVLPNLKSSLLMSLGQSCNNDCKVLLDKKNQMSMKITKWF